MRLGMIARCDDGGLGTMTWEFWRRMRPDYTILVMMGERARGEDHPERYEGGGVVWHNHGPELDRRLASRLLRHADVVYTAETAYADDFWHRANLAGTPTVLHAMPELYDLRNDPQHRPSFVWAPTEWEHRPRSRIRCDRSCSSWCSWSRRSRCLP